MRLRSHRERIGRLWGVRDGNVSKYSKLEFLSTAVAVMSLVLLLSTLVFRYGYFGTRWYLLFNNAAVTILRLNSSTVEPGWAIIQNPGPELTWTARVPSGYWGIVCPLWIPIVMAAAGAVLFHRRARPRRVGHCFKCDYDLTGNTSGICPECGTAVRTSASENDGRNS